MILSIGSLFLIGLPSREIVRERRNDIFFKTRKRRFEGDFVPKINPLSGDLEQVKQAILKMDRVAIIKETDHYIHNEFTGLIMRYVDDVEFTIIDPGKVLRMIVRHPE